MNASMKGRISGAARRVLALQKKRAWAREQVVVAQERVEGITEEIEHAVAYLNKLKAENSW